MLTCYCTITMSRSMFKRASNFSLTSENLQAKDLLHAKICIIFWEKYKNVFARSFVLLSNFKEKLQLLNKTWGYPKLNHSFFCIWAIYCVYQISALFTNNSKSHKLSKSNFITKSHLSFIVNLWTQWIIW